MPRPPPFATDTSLQALQSRDLSRDERLLLEARLAASGPSVGMHLLLLVDGMFGFKRPRSATQNIWTGDFLADLTKGLFFPNS